MTGVVDGKKFSLSKEDFLKVLEADADGSEIQQAYKVSLKHLECTRNERQRVRLACEEGLQNRK